MKLPIIDNLFKYFLVFYGYVGKKLFFLCFLVFLGGICDSFGLSLLLPLFNIDKPAASLDSYTHFIHQLIASTGLPVSLYTILLFMIVAFSLKGAFTFIQNLFYAGITTNLARDWRLNMVRRYADMRYYYYTNTSIGYLNNIITKEIDRSMSGFNKFIDVLVNIVYIFLYLCVAIAFNWMMTLIAVALCCGLFILFGKFSLILRRLSLKESELNASIQAILIQVIYNFKYLKATRSFAQLYRQLDKQITDFRNVSFRVQIINTVPRCLLEPLTVLLLSALIIIQVALIGNSIAGSFILLVFFHKTFSRVFGFQHIWQLFCSYVGGIEVVEKARHELELNKEPFDGRKLDGFKHSIVLQDVNVSYGGQQVLFDINMTIPKNRSIGIVGESGAGKTTVFDILAGLITPESGKICIDGIDYRELGLSSLRGMIGYVTQEPVMFNDTIANNISFWECGYVETGCKERIEKAAELGNCATFVEASRNGYETVVGDKGIRLSGGERQRISIAREIFKEPDIMIFDEATSSLDTESEEYIQKSIDKMKGRLTLIVIAHRLSTIRNCDYVYVLSRGRIVEEGEFNRLYEQDGSQFRKMCLSQHL